VRGGGARLTPRPYKRHEIARFRELLDANFPLIGKRGPGSLEIKRYFRGVGTLKGPLRKHARRLQFEAQVSLALEEGLRRAEIFYLTLPQMAPDNQAVVVKTAKSRPGQTRWREIPFTLHSRECVREWLEFRRVMAPTHERPWLLLSPSRGPSAAQTFHHFERSLELKCLGNYWKWHRFRHTFATERLRAGLPLEKLQIMMGHANLAQTLAYAEIVNADVQAEADRTEEQFARNLGLIA
jgi:site-specific recombinase XerD